MRSIRQTLVAAALLLAAAQAQAALVYQTTMTLSDPDNSAIPLTSAVYDWETNATSGAISSANLLNLTLALFNGPSLVYTDAMIVNGAVQPIGGAGRVLTDIIWAFNLDSLTVTDADNDRGDKQASSATGLTYRFAAIPGFGVIFRYDNGSQKGVTGFTMSQVTVPTEVPVAPTALLLLGGLTLLARRRKA